MPATFSGRLLRQVSRLFGGLAFVILLTVACGGDEAGSNRSDVETTPTIIPSTPLPLPDASNPFRGSARVDDQTGDVEGSGDVPPGVDLTGVRIVPSKGNLVIIWYTAEQAETRVDEGSTASWIVQLANGDQPAYDITFTVAGKEWDILVLDHATGEETKHRIGSIYRDRLDVPYPAANLPNLQPTFTWTARSHYTDATGATWSDVVPEDGQRSTFPN